jgi:hypothetical protein
VIDDAITALTGALGGGALRLLPEAISLWRDHDQHDNAVELARVDLAKTSAELENALELAKVWERESEQKARARMAAAHAEEMLIYAQRGGRRQSSAPLVDVLARSVRPVVTYWLLAFYTAYKIVVIYDAMKQGVPVASLAPILRTDDDVAIFSGAITYWFIDQTITRAASVRND